MKKDLQLLGLSKNEATAYELLVKHGPCKASIIINKAAIHRNLVYRALDSLVENGYATKVIKRGVWNFQITDPQSLLTSMRRKERVFGEILKEIKEHQSRRERQIVVYEGVESYKSYWLNALEAAPEGVVDYVAGGELKAWYELLGKDKDRYLELGKKKRLSWKTLYFGINSEERQLLKESPIPLEVRLWPEPIEKFRGNFNVFSNTVILHTMMNPPRIIELRDTPIVAMFQNYFDIMWGKADTLVP